MDSNRRIVRDYKLFANQIICKVSIDEIEVLQIVVDMENLHFSISLCDCTLDVLANESTILCKLISDFNSGVC